MEPEAEVIELFKLILEEKFQSTLKSKFDRENKLKKEVSKLNERKSKLLEKLLDDIISNETYETCDKDLSNQILDCKEKLRKLGESGDSIRSHVNFGVYMLQNFKELYKAAPTAIQNKLLGSILEEKLHFSNKKYRTPQFKEGFGFIYQNIKLLKEVTRKKGDNPTKASLTVPGAGVEPARTQCPQDFKSCVSTNSTTRASNFALLRFKLSFKSIGFLMIPKKKTSQSRRLSMEI